MNEFKTNELVEELEKREAVQSIWIEPYQDFKLTKGNESQDLAIKQGPAKILIIWD